MFICIPCFATTVVLIEISMRVSASCMILEAIYTFTRNVNLCVPAKFAVYKELLV